ncbi:MULTISPECIES: hypothetical protein [Legionella]|nr:hypothetical protein [Legionella maceachernii]
MMQEVSQSNSLGCLTHTLFQPPNQLANQHHPMQLSATGSRILQQQGDLVSSRLEAAYHVLEQALLDDTESDNARFTY